MRLGDKDEEEGSRVKSSQHTNVEKRITLCMIRTMSLCYYPCAYYIITKTDLITSGTS